MSNIYLNPSINRILRLTSIVIYTQAVQDSPPLALPAATSLAGCLRTTLPTTLERTIFGVAPLLTLANICAEELLFTKAGGLKKRPTQFMIQI